RGRERSDRAQGGRGPGRRPRRGRRLDPGGVEPPAPDRRGGALPPCGRRAPRGARAARRRGPAGRLERSRDRRDGDAGGGAAREEPRAWRHARGVGRRAAPSARGRRARRADAGRRVSDMSRERWNEHIREALAEVEEQRDDAVVYLSAIKVLLDLLARGHTVKQCGQEIAEALVQQLALETCAVGLCDEPDRDLTLVGFATQAQRLGGPRGGLGESGWLALARLLKPGMSPTCFRRRTDGGFDAVSPGELAGEGFFVLPFAVSGEPGGALLLHSLASPAQAFTRDRALSLLADIVGQVLTVARMRASVVAL